MIDKINSQLPHIPIRPKNSNSQKFVVSEVPYENEVYKYRAFAAIFKDTNESCGAMLCEPHETIKGDKVVRSMYIGELHTSSMHKGAGTALLDHALSLCGEEDCVGIHLVASGCYSRDRVPHIFYRKYGMNTGDRKLDKKMDMFIRTGKIATYKDFKEVKMFYPPVEYPKKNTVLHKIFRCLKNIFTTSKKCVAR